MGILSWLTVRVTQELQEKTGPRGLSSSPPVPLRVFYFLNFPRWCWWSHRFGNFHWGVSFVFWLTIGPLPLRVFLLCSCLRFLAPFPGAGLSVDSCSLGLRIHCLHFSLSFHLLPEWASSKPEGLIVLLTWQPSLTLNQSFVTSGG